MNLGFDMVSSYSMAFLKQLYSIAEQSNAAGLHCVLVEAAGSTAIPSPKSFGSIGNGSLGNPRFHVFHLYVRTSAVARPSERRSPETPGENDRSLSL